MRSTRIGSLTARIGVGIVAATLVSLAAVSPGARPLRNWISGEPGSPGATITLDGHYLPAPPQRFGGSINLDADKSRPWWPARIVPPKSAPNVLLIMTDDAGYGVSGTFGGV